MLKEKLQSLYELHLDMRVDNTIKQINDLYDEDQLNYLLNNGLRLRDGVILKYYNENIGFQCHDEYYMINGKSSLCQNIERFLNRKN